MAAGKLTREEGGPIAAVAYAASRKIEEAIALLDERPVAGDAGPVQAAPSAKPGSQPARTKRKGQ